tara:strand:- start:1063 stop:1191 length:129 start_codon:yes stop_codon:yes gene_type:complete
VPNKRAKSRKRKRRLLNEELKSYGRTRVQVRKRKMKEELNAL